MIGIIVIDNMNILIRCSQVFIVRIDTNLVHGDIAQHFIMPKNPVHMRQGVWIATIWWKWIFISTLLPN